MASSQRQAAVKIEELCRTCLSKDNALHSLFDVFVGTVSLEFMVTAITGLKISKGDGLPSTICCECKEKAEKAFDFKKKSQEAHISLKGLFKKEMNEYTSKDKVLNQTNDNMGVKTEHELNHDNDDDFLDCDFNLPLSNREDDLDNLGFEAVKNEREIQENVLFFECKNCCLIFDSHSKLENHRRKKCIKVEYDDPNGSSYCPLCGTCYDGAENLSKHMWEFHAELMGPKKRGRPKKILTSSIINKLSENGLHVTSIPSKKYDCGFCKEQSKTKEELNIHMMEHRNVKVMCCILCKKMYLKKKKIDVHTCIEDKGADMSSDLMQSNKTRQLNYLTEVYLQEIMDPNCDMENNNLIQVCSTCNGVFLSEGDLVNHTDAEHPELSQRCNLCSKVFASIRSAARHRSICKQIERKFRCNTCGLKFAYEISLNKHILRYHEGQSVSVKFMDTKAKLEERKFQCDTCNKCFHRKEALVKHTKIHMPNQKYFECDICQKKFRRSDNLRSHKRVHDLHRTKNTSSNCLCLYCGRGFSNSSNLIVHMRRHTGEKPYKCDFCEKGFPRSSDLQCHRRSHTGEKPCICGICGKGFSRSNKLSRHMRVHTGQRPYKCTYCEKAFSQSNDLTLHIRRHTGDRPYICEICGDRFIQGTALQNHRRAHGHFPPATSVTQTQVQPITYTVSNITQQ